MVYVCWSRNCVRNYRSFIFLGYSLDLKAMFRIGWIGSSPSAAKFDILDEVGLVDNYLKIGIKLCKRSDITPLMNSYGKGSEEKSLKSPWMLDLRALTETERWVLEDVSIVAHGVPGISLEIREHPFRISSLK